MIEFSKKFQRIFLQEIVDKVNHKIEKQFNNSTKMSQLKVKEIVISLINKGLILANYDDPSNGIEFLVMERKIDELHTKFDEWSKEDKKKV